MAHPPPVPPKDTPCRSNMDIDRTPHERPGSSKRKREAHDDNVYELRDGRLEVTADADAYTPKRSRSHPQQSDGATSDDATPMQQRNIRRKKGVRNLSNLNLRHAAERQDHAEAQRLASKESKFLEGSLNDKPSQKPPSAFTRFIRTDSGNLQYVDELMADYHNGMHTPRVSAEIAIAREKAEIPERVAAIAAQSEPTEENKSFLFRFGRQLAASFHPVRMWKQVWEETAEELRQKNMAEIERKRLLKEEVEQKYAQMKAAGQFAPKHVSHVSAGQNTVTPRDSGVDMSSARPSIELTRPMTNHSDNPPQSYANNSPEEVEPPETGHKVIRTIRSRLNFKRPSLSNLRLDLKRSKSDYNLAAAAAANRESSSSVSPIKTDADVSAIKKSASKVDLKKQYKLSKRVSDLELKLQHARKELDHALVQASPMPQLGNKHERFHTPNSTLKRPRFAKASGLPSLPSERLLDPEGLGFAPGNSYSIHDNGTTQAHAEAAAALEGAGEPRNGLDLMGEREGHTIRNSRSNRSYPARVDSLFKLDNKPTVETSEADTSAGATGPLHHEAQPEDTDMADNINVANNAYIEVEPHQVEPKQSKSYSSLDAEASEKVARKPSKSKKRKSGADGDEKAFNPDAEVDNGSELEQSGGKSKAKKRKSVGAKGESKSSPPATKKSKRVSPVPKASPLSKKGSKIPVPSNPVTHSNSDSEPFETDPLSHTPVRTSLDSQSLASLEPVAEEDEEIVVAATTANPFNSEPSKSTTDATPARQNRARSSSPTKRFQPGSEEKLFTRAAEAAQKTRSANSNDTTSSPPLGSKAVCVNVGKENKGNGITVIPGEGGAPELPSGPHRSNDSFVEPGGKGGVLDNGNVNVSPRKGRSKSKMARGKSGPDEAFEWPEDVF